MSIPIILSTLTLSLGLVTWVEDGSPLPYQQEEPSPVIVKQEEARSHHPDLFFSRCHFANLKQTGLTVSIRDHARFLAPLSRPSQAPGITALFPDRLASVPALRLTPPEKPSLPKLALRKKAPIGRPTAQPLPRARVLPRVQALPRAEVMKVTGRANAPFAHLLFCAKHETFCQPGRGQARIRLDRKTYQSIQAVHKKINRLIRPRHDHTIGNKDLWQIAITEGDCEDYALRKLKELKALGLPSRALLLATAFLPDGQAHAVLIVKTDRGDFVLDNLKSGINRLQDARLRWHRVQSSENPKVWLKVSNGARNSGLI